jgi:small subunit ribosomal protein S1
VVFLSLSEDRILHYYTFDMLPKRYYRSTPYFTFRISIRNPGVKSKFQEERKVMVLGKRSGAEVNQNTEFARLFEESLKVKSFKEGEIVKGKVIRVNKDVAVVDVGLKSEGVIPIEEFINIQGEVAVQVGDDVDVYLESMENDDGQIILSKEQADAAKTWDDLVAAHEAGKSVEGVVLSKVKGGLSVNIGIKAFLPGSQVDIRPVKNLDKFVGNVYKFEIIKLNKKRGNVVLSRKSLLEKERQELRKEALETIQEGQILEGVVKNITDYGVFVDLGGLDGLLHITDMTWGRINHPSEMFSVGDDIRVKVMKFDEKNERVSLGLKQLQPDPWSGVEEKYPVGSRVSGKVVSLTDYGAFVELEDGVEGMIHVSEMSWTKKVKHPSKVLNVGDEIDSVVLDVDIPNRRISLGLKQIGENPWESIAEKYPLGTKLSGTIKNIADFGLFVDVEGDVDGLVHLTDLSWVQNYAHPSETFKKGDKLEVMVIHLDPENERFSLGLKQLQDDPWDKISTSYNVDGEYDGKVIGVSSTGTIVELESGVEGLIPKKLVKKELANGAEIKVKVTVAESKDRHFHLELVGDDSAATEEKAEEVKPEEVKAEEVKAEEVKAEEVKPEEVKAEEVKPEEVKAEEVKAEEVVEAAPEEKKAEEVVKVAPEEKKAEEKTEEKAEAPAEEVKEPKE